MFNLENLLVPFLNRIPSAMAVFFVVLYELALFANIFIH